MRLTVLIVLTALLAACADDATNPTVPDPIVATRDGEVLSREALADRLATADVVILGEIHDNPDHHANQGWLIARIAAPALAAEMLVPDQETKAAQHLGSGGAAEDLGPVIGWAKSGWPDWEIYRPAFAALPAGGTLLAGGLPRETVRRAVKEGAAGLTPDERFVAVLERPLDADVQAEMEAEMVASHCGHLPPEMASGMVEGQRLRDSSLAAAVLRGHAATGGPVVLITGNGHARKDRGVPVYIAEIAPELEIVTLGQIEEGGQSAPGEYPFDYVWTTVRHEREDPCEVFRKPKE